MNFAFPRSAVALLCILAIARVSSANTNHYSENFNTTTYEDAANTTAWWDTGSGELKLAPFAPWLIGAYDTPGDGYRVVADGNLLYVADGGAGLTIVDMTNPASPTLLGSYDTPGVAADVAVAGNLAYVADTGQGLRILDVTNPSSPTSLGTLGTLNSAYGVAVAGNLVFLAVNTAGLEIVDVTNPSSPSLVGSYNTPYTANDVVVDGDLAFVADGTTLQIISIANPASPTLVGSCVTTPGQAMEVAVDGDYAFIANYGSLTIVDITNPASPTVVGSFASAGHVNGVAVSGDRAFLACDTEGLKVVDITNPSAPTLLESYDTPAVAYGVAVSGTRAVVADEFDGIQIIRHAVEMNPPRVLGSGALPSFAGFMKVEGNLAFVTGDTGLWIFDISNPAAPSLVGNYDVTYPELGVDVDLAGNVAILADRPGGILTIDISDPTNPKLLGTCGGFTWSLAVVAEGNFAYVADGNAGLIIIDISNPASPTQVGSYDPTTGGSDVTVQGHLAYLGAGLSGLKIIDVSNPAAPALLGTYDTNPEYASDVAVAGDLAFVGCGAPGGYSGSLRVIDISNAASPSLVGNYPVTYSYPQNVTPYGDHVLMFEYNHVSLLDLSNPALPTLAWDLASGSTLGTPSSLAVAGDLAYVTNYSAQDALTTLQIAQHDFDAIHNLARSLPVDPDAIPIVCARLSTTQTAEVDWEISNDAGTSWVNMTPDNSWLRFGGPSSGLQWRTTHYYATAGVNPSVSDLSLDWRYQGASIQAVTDVPGDQGGRVYVDWLRSGYDFADETQFPITGYNLYRRVSGTAIAAAAASASVQPGSELLTPDGKTAWPLSGAEVFTVSGRTYVQGTGIGKTTAATFPSGTWALVGSAFATQSDAYEMEATTEADSSVWGVNDAVFLVTAHTTAPSIWYVSEPDSGHSVDNIAPAVPTNFAVAYNTGSGNSLTWDPSPDADFQYFRVYRSPDPAFVPSPASLAQETVSPSWVDPDNNAAGIYYKVTALDYDGNESDPAEAGTVTAVGGSTAIRSFALYPNVPNPFNPRTRIAFDVPGNGGAVSLVVYDTSGRLVKTLVAGTLTAGRHTAEWDCHDAAGRPVASGVYFYRLTARGVDLRKKMVLVK